jgi:hypothetical protein
MLSKSYFGHPFLIQKPDSCLRAYQSNRIYPDSLLFCLLFVYFLLPIESTSTFHIVLRDVCREQRRLSLTRTWGFFFIPHANLSLPSLAIIFRRQSAAGGFAVNDDAPIEDDAATSGADVEITDVTQLVEQFVLREHKQQERVSDAKAQVRQKP